jgi:hypothetical protein
MKYLKSFFESLRDFSDIQIKEITLHDFQEIKLPYSTKLSDGSDHFPLTDNEMEPMKKFLNRIGSTGYLYKSRLDSNQCDVGLSDGDDKVGIRYFKSDESSYWIQTIGGVPKKKPMVGTGFTGKFGSRLRYFTTNDGEVFKEFILEILIDLMDWIDSKGTTNEV